LAEFIVHIASNSNQVHEIVQERERQTDRQTYRQTDRQREFHEDLQLSILTHNSVIHLEIHIAPLQGNYSEVPTSVWTKR